MRYGLQWGVGCREMVNLTNPARVAAAGLRDLPDPALQPSRIGCWLGSNPTAGRG